MNISFTTRTALSPMSAAQRIIAMGDHRVPFTRITQNGDRVSAVTRLGPIVIDDTMEIGPLIQRGTSVRGSITKTGTVLGGTLLFSAVETPSGTRVGWRQNLTFLPCRALDPILAVVMRVGYGIAFKALLR